MAPRPGGHDGDVALLDRFEVLSETGPDSDLTGTAGLIVYDLLAGRTVDVSAAAVMAFAPRWCAVVVDRRPGDPDVAHLEPADNLSTIGHGHGHRRRPAYRMTSCTSRRAASPLSE
jgi:hypothetical protein